MNRFGLRDRLRERPARAILAALLALAGAAFAFYHALTWPIATLVSGRAWEVGGLPEALLLSAAFLLGGALLGAGALTLLNGYYGMAARLILAGGVLSGYGIVELALALPAALLGGTIPPPEDRL